VAHDLVVFVGQDHLAFTGDEVQQVLALRHKLELTPEQAQELVAASEGWITGIVLATNAAWRGIRDVLHHAKTRGGPVYDYLAQQAFEAEPLYDAMLAMSTLPEMSEGLCRQALGLSGADGVLQELERRGIFLTTVEDDAGVRHHRYHHLFRNFLQESLRKKAPERFADLHRRAAGWFELQEQWEQAVSQRQSAGDQRALLQTMENGAKPLYLAGRLDTLVNWYESAPAPLRSEYPRLLLFTARALYDLSRADEALPLLHRAETISRARDEMETALAAMLQRASVRYVQGRYAEMLSIAREALAVQETRDLSFPLLIADTHRLIGFASLCLGQSDDSVQHLQLALDLYQELGTREVGFAYMDLSFALLRIGRINEGWACQDKAIERLRQLGPSHYLAITLNNVACERHYLTGDYIQALTRLREALDVAQKAGSSQARAFIQLSMADIYRDLGALEQAQTLYAQAEDVAHKLSQADLLNFALLGAAQSLLQAGDVVAAQGRAAQAHDQARLREDTYQVGLSCLALGAIYLKSGAPHKALDEIRRGRDQLLQIGARRDLTRAYMLLARAHQDAGDVESALDALGQALDVGIETRTFHHLVIEGQYAFDLLRQLVQRNPVDRRTAQIMDRIRELPGVARQLIGGAAPLTTLQRRPSIRFYGFGPGSAKRGDKTVAWRAARARYLIFYFLLYPTRTREQIYADFWPEHEGEAARSIFHVTKSRAKKALGRQCIIYEDGLYRLAWDPDCWFDVTAFESLLDGRDGERQSRLEQAIALYQGDLLGDYDARWLLSIRDRLRQRFMDALLELGEIYVEQSKLATARAVLKQAVALDDFYEPAIQALMRLYTLDQQPRLALDTFHQFGQRLQQIGALPEPETQSLYLSIQTSF
jgi:ATP/maltotriose-dependent transcriptional regulator MalT/DNA-binding SARP family transcriptional activator